VARNAITLEDVAVAIGNLAGGPLAGACLLELATAKALAQDGAFVLGDGPLDLQQKLVVGVVADRALHEHDLTAGSAELFEEKDLISIFAGEAVRAEDGHDVELSLARGVAEAVQSRPIEPCPGVTLVGEDVLRWQFVPL
jgi:hypothetical protein